MNGDGVTTGHHAQIGSASIYYELHGQGEPVHGEFLIHQLDQTVSYCRFGRKTLPSGTMKDIMFLLFDLLTTLTKLLRPGESCGIGFFSARPRMRSVA
jgi:hypothetical protein